MVNSVLQQSIENLYQVFQKYPLKARIEGCPCCVSETDQAHLRAQKLRELSEDNLERYAFKAISTWGDENDFKHFLPRIFELLTYPSSSLDLTITIPKLSTANWQTWSENEQMAVQDFLYSYWQYWINSQENDSILRIYESIAMYVSKPHKLLASWQLADNEIGIYNLVELVYYGYQTIQKKNIYWEIRQWLTSPLVMEKLQNAFFDYVEKDADFAEKISSCEQLLSWDRVK